MKEVEYINTQDIRAKKHRQLQVWSTAPIMNMVLDSLKPDSEELSEFTQIQVMLQNHTNSLLPVNSKQNFDKIPYPNAIDAYSRQTYAIYDKLQNWQKQYKKMADHSDHSDAILFYTTLVMDKLEDDIQVLKRMNAGYESISDGINKYSNLTSKYGLDKNQRPVAYMPPVENMPADKTRKNGNLQIKSMAPITDRLFHLIQEEHKDPAVKEKINQINNDLINLHIKIKPYDRKATAASIPEQIRKEAADLTQKVRNDLATLRQTCETPSKEAQYLFDLADQKLHSDATVLYKHAEHSSLYDTTILHADLPNHFGLTQKQDAPIPYYSMEDDRIGRISMDLHKLQKSLDKADPKTLLTGTSYYTNMKNAMNDLTKWLDNYEKVKKTLPKSDPAVDPHVFMIKLTAAIIQTKIYLDHKDADVRQDHARNINRVEQPKRQTREQPRIRAAFHTYDILKHLADCKPFGKTPVIPEGYDATIREYKAKLLSKASKEIFAKENDPKYQPKEAAKDLKKPANMKL